MRNLYHCFYTILVALSLVHSAYATTVTVTYTDGPAEGFNDPATRTPVTGNSGTTLGQQRKNVYEAVADYWESRLDSNVDITITASFDPQLCNAFAALLGSAGPNTSHMNFPVAPLPDVLYPAALANSLANSDLAPATADIVSDFNSTLDLGNADCLGGATWDYRLGVQSADGLGLYDTVLHEVAHGLGFITFVDDTTGEKQMGLDDHYMLHLFDESTMKSWPDMTDLERLVSVTNEGNVVFAGPKAVAESAFLTGGLNNGKPRVFTPDPLQAGSSVSHWDSALLPDELMEPAATVKTEDWLTIKAFFDMGWKGTPCTKTQLPANQWIMFSLDCVPPVGQATVADIIGDDIAGSYLATWAVFEFNETTGVYIQAPPAATMEVGKGYWVQHINPGMVTIDLPIDSHRTPSQISAANGCKPGDTCFSQTLATPGALTIKWDMIGNPFREDISMSDLRVITDSGTCVSGCTLADARTGDIMLDIGHTWTATSTKTYMPLNAADKLPAGASMWVATLPSSNALNPRLLFPR